MKKIRSNIIIALIITIFTVNYISVSAAPSDTIKNEIEANKDAMNEKEQEKNKIQEKKEAQNTELDELFKKIEAKSEELSVAEKDVEVYQVKIDKLQEEMDTIQASIDSAEEEIDQKEKLIIEKEKELVETQGMLGERIRSYYKMNVASQYLYMMLKSDGLGDLLSNIQSIYRIMNIDKNLMDNIKLFQKELSIEKDNLDKRVAKDKVDKENIATKQNEIFEAQKEFVLIKDAKQSQMDELLALESEKEDIIASLTEDELALQHEIGSLTSYNTQLQDELDAIFNSINNGSNSGSGGNTGGSGSTDESAGEGFLRPTNGPITDAYGERTNPVTGEKGFHKGVDFGDTWDTPIKASKSGVVTFAGVINGYGNCVIIDHGDGVTTLYAHAATLNVSVNQSVTRGETIALVGSTGMSTGPHLHFEIRINEQHVNPMNYV